MFIRSHQHPLKMLRRQLCTVGPRVLENYHFLRRIATSKSDGRRLALLQNATSDQLLSIVEVAANIMSSNFSLTRCQKNKLAGDAHFIRKLARTRSESGARKLVQRGNGFIFSSLLLPVLGEAARLLLTRN